MQPASMYILAAWWSSHSFRQLLRRGGIPSPCEMMRAGFYPSARITRREKADQGTTPVCSRSSGSFSHQRDIQRNRAGGDPENIGSAAAAQAHVQAERTRT